MGFWRWLFLSSGNSICYCHSFNTIKQHCYWMPVQPLKGSYLVGIQLLEISFLHLSVKRHLRHSFAILSGGANTIQTSLIKLHCMWRFDEKIIEKQIQWLFWRDFVIFKTTFGLRFSSALSFLSKHKSNWQKYIVSLARRYQNLKPHLIGLFLKYCFMLDHPFSFTLCSSMLWESSFETELLKL